jgi:beta-lactamase regulating signal transducer with metallopeptidase domain
MNALTAFFKSTLEISLFASAMIMVVLLIKAIAKDRIHIKFVSFLWLLVILRLCVPGMLESPVHVDGLLPETAKTQETAGQVVTQNVASNDAQDVTYENQLQDNEAASPINIPAKNTAQTQTVPFYEEVFSFIKSMDLWLSAAVLWMIGGAIMLAFVLRESIVFGLRIRKNSHPLANPQILGIIAKHQSANHIRRNIRVSVSSSIQMPLAFGAIHPHILLPAHLTDELSKEHIDAILLHEVCHIKRNDILKSYACVLAKTLHWFNPLVWIGLKKMKEDMEFACDQRVIKLLKPGQEVSYCESLLVATRFMQERRLPQLATALCESKSNLKKRIVKMIKPQKTYKSAIAVSLVLALIMCIACFTTACQPTPEKPVIISKNNSNLENAITATPIPKSTPNQTSVKKEATNMVAKGRWADGTASKLTTVNIDAKIVMPNVTSYPVFQVAPTIVDKTMAEKFVKYIAKDAVLVKNGELQTKEALQESIIRLQKEITNVKAGKLPPDDSRPAIEQLAGLEDQLKETKDEYDKVSAAGDTTGQPLDYTFNPEFSFKGRTMACFTAQMKNGSNKLLRFEQCSEGGPTFSLIGIIDESFLDVKKGGTDGSAVSPDKARVLALEAIRELDIGDFDLASEKIAAHHNELVFYRSYNGIPVTDISHSGGNSSGVGTEEETKHSFVLWQEYLRFYIDNTGIILLDWRSPCGVTREINKNVALKPLDDIKKIFKQQILYNVYEGDGQKKTIQIKKVQLGYMVVPEKDNISSYRTIPVWDFIGPYSTDQEEIDSLASHGIDLTDPISFLTVNAIDGSVIDRNLGY